jgi:hypothetical protein
MLITIVGKKMLQTIEYMNNVCTKYTSNEIDQFNQNKWVTAFKVSH